MVKKVGVNIKAEAARARKSAAEAERKLREAREKEDQYWREAEGGKSRAAKKREEEAEKRAAAAAKKAEARRLAEQEEKELEKISMRKPAPAKVTEAELRRLKEEEQAARTVVEKKKQSRVANEEEYERMVSAANKNRFYSVIEARTVDEAVALMTEAVNNLLEKRLKAAFKSFEVAELTKLKIEKPGLTHSQYIDMSFKRWKRSQLS